MAGVLLTVCADSGNQSQPSGTLAAVPMLVPVVVLYVATFYDNEHSECLQL